MIINLNEKYGFIRVTGPDAAKFLQGQCSANTERLTSGNTTLAITADPNGRIQCLFRLIRLNDAFYLRMDKSLLEMSLAHFKKYSIFSKVELTISDTNLWIYASKGPLQNAALTAQTRPECFVESYLTAPLSEPCEAPLLDWDSQQIMAGVPELYATLAGHYTPHELNLQALGAIDFKKGCYTGQEIIARMEYRAKLKQHLYIAEAEIPNKLGLREKVLNTDGNTIGEVVNFVQNAGKTWLLITIKDAYIDQALIGETRLSVTPPPYDLQIVDI